MEPDKKIEKAQEDYKKKYEDLQTKFADLNKAHADEIAELNKKHDTAVEDLAKKIQKESAVPITDTQAKQEAASALSDAKPQSVAALTLGMATANQITTDYGVHAAHPNDVKFEVTNPKDTGMQKGIIVISKESADQFTEKGFGKIV